MWCDLLFPARSKDMSTLLGLLFLTAALLLFYSLFFYEERNAKLLAADKRLCNIFSDVWIRLDDAKNRGVAAHIRFVRAVADMTNTGYDKLFGANLISLRVVGISGCYRVASVLLVSLAFVLIDDYVLHLDELSGGYSTGRIHPVVIVSSMFLTLGTLPMFIRDRPILLSTPNSDIMYDWVVHFVRTRGGMNWWFASLLFMSFAAWLTVDVISRVINPDTQTSNPATSLRPNDIAPVLMFMLFAWLMVSAVIDVLFIATTRRLMRLTASISSIGPMIVYVVLGISVAAAIVLAPLSVVYVCLKIGISVPRPVGIVVMLITLSSLITGLVALVLIVLPAFFLLVHRAIYPALQKPIYLLQRVGVIRHKKLALVLGITLAIQGLKQFGLSMTMPPLLKDVLSILVG